jgi:hypothetical protein
MPNYQLVNPYIEGNFETSYSGKKPIDAAEKLWGKLSSYMTGNIPRFAFSMERASDGKLYHFTVKESVKGETVDFSLTEEKVKLKKKLLDGFKSKLTQLKNKSQQGGKKKKKRKKDSSSSSDSDEDLLDKVLKHRYNHVNQPILYWWYTPTLYDSLVESVFVPSWTVPLVPYMEYYWPSSAFWGP